MEHKIRVAAATSDGISVNVHFGHAFHYHIYEMDFGSAEGGWRFVGEVEIPFVKEKADSVCAGKGEENILQIAVCLSGCTYVLVEKIGPRPHKILLREGLECLETDAEIQEALQQVQSFVERRGNV